MYQKPTDKQIDDLLYCHFKFDTYSMDNVQNIRDNGELHIVTDNISKRDVKSVVSFHATHRPKYANDAQGHHH